MTTIAFIGLGTMGLPMAKNLVKAGYAVAGFDINGDAVQALAEAGGTAAASAGDAVQSADFVITMLPVGRYVKEVLFGASGIATSMPKQALFIEMSTIAPLDTDEVHARLQELGMAMVDAPVGRLSPNAVDGTLLIMAGGETGDIERARPLFECLGDTIVHCGGPGMGSRMKIVNNYMAIVTNVLTAEALTLAERSGLDVDLALEVMRGTTAGRGPMNTTYPAKVLQGDLAPGFMVDLADKDLGLALDFAGAMNLPLSVGAAARSAYSVARTQGRGRDDWTAVYQVARRMAGLAEGGGGGSD